MAEYIIRGSIYTHKSVSEKQSLATIQAADALVGNAADIVCNTFFNPLRNHLAAAEALQKSVKAVLSGVVDDAKFVAPAALTTALPTIRIEQTIDANDPDVAEFTAHVEWQSESHSVKFVVRADSAIAFTMLGHALIEVLEVDGQDMTADPYHRTNQSSVAARFITLHLS